MGNASNNALFASKPKTPPPSKKDNPAKVAICHQCCEVRHWRRNCPVYLVELMKKKKLSQGASTLGALSLYVGDGHRATVEAIATYHLELPSGLVIVLNNYHYAPSITRVSKNNLVYFMAVHRDGIFEIDMSCSNTNDSSIKKRIEKLQHDGLLNSIDIESLGKCVSCMSGKMAKKPYSHQVERFTWTNIHRYTSLNHEEDDQETDEPLCHINPIRKSSRTHCAPDHMCLYIDAEEHELEDLGKPANYKVALQDPESKKWLDAMNVKMQSLKDDDVCVLVELPPNARTVGSKWLFKKKTDMDGALYIFKAHLVTKGFTQTYVVDYKETFSPVVDIRAIGILIAIAAYYDYEIWQMDVKTAFLNGHVSEKVYMKQPEGFVNLKYPNHVCKLKHSIYGLKQASRQWNNRFDDDLIRSSNLFLLKGNQRNWNNLMEDRLKLNELMELSTKLFDRVLALENIKTAQAKEIANLKKKVKKLERKRRSRTPGMNLFKIGTSKRRSLSEKDASK
nr:putative retrotransposon Ty1-copia subclass protein [Tanacetum cinerariifolium]